MEIYLILDSTKLEANKKSSCSSVYVLLFSGPSVFKFAFIMHVPKIKEEFLNYLVYDIFCTFDIFVV